SRTRMWHGVGNSFLFSTAVGASAPELSARWRQLVAFTLFSREICCRAFTCVLFWGQCAGGCAIAGWREVRERSGQKCRWVSRSGWHCPPNRAPLLHGTLSHSLQHRNRRRQHAARQRMPPPPRVRPGRIHVCCCVSRGHPVWHSGVPKISSQSQHTTPGTGRGVFVSWETPRWSSPSHPPCGRTPDVPLVLTQADGGVMTPQRGSCFHDGGVISAGLRIGNMNGESRDAAFLIACLCCANCRDVP
ncbi:hypothetical protein MOQ_000881, partial [Trypanosoma cruzi marinkellei]